MILSSKVSLSIAVLGCFLLAPSKVAAVAYALMLGGLVIMIFIGLGLMGWASNFIKKSFR